MLDVLISNKTRVKLLLRFFLNPQQKAYLRGLEKEFQDSTNSIRLELNRFEEAGLIESFKEGNKKMYRVNAKYPLFEDLHTLAMKHFGVDQILDHIISNLGSLKYVYLTGDLAAGRDSDLLDIAIVGDHIDREYLATLAEKTELLINRKIRTVVFGSDEMDKIPVVRLLIFEERHIDL
jgi:DNA-binding transcriptional ArsR family regulator